MNQNYKYLIAAIIGVLVTLLLFKACNPKSDTPAEGKIKTTIDTVYQIKKDTVTITLNKIKHNYIYRTKTDTIQVINDSIKFWKYEIDTLVTSNKNDVMRFNAKGWGYLDELKLTNYSTDTITRVYTTIEKEKIVFKLNKGLYISGQYNIPLSQYNDGKPFYSIGVDKQILKDRIMIGASTTIQDKPIIGLRIGIKLN